MELKLRSVATAILSARLHMYDETRGLHLAIAGPRAKQT